MAKRLWTPSFLAAHAALGIALLALAVLAFDSRVAPGGRPGPAVRPRLAGDRPRPQRAGAVDRGVPRPQGARDDAGRPDAVPLGEHLLAMHGAVGYFLLTGGVAVAVACAMHAARWHVRL